MSELPKQAQYILIATTCNVIFALIAILSFWLSNDIFKFNYANWEWYHWWALIGIYLQIAGMTCYLAPYIIRRLTLKLNKLIKKAEARQPNKND